MEGIKSVVKKLKDVSNELHQSLTHLNGVSSLSVDDEFEVEFLVDQILKSSRKLNGIIKTCPISEKENVDTKGTEEETVNSGVGVTNLGDRSGPVVSLVLHSDTESESEGCEKVRELVPCRGVLAADSDNSGDGLRESSHESLKQEPISEKHSEQGTAFGESDAESDVTVDLDNSLQGIEAQREAVVGITGQSTEDLSVLEKSEIEGCLEAFAADEFDDDEDFNDNILEEVKKAEDAALDAGHPELEVDDPQEEEAEEDEVSEAVDQKFLSVLKSYFGFSKFRPMQWRIINAVLNDHRDNCVLMATGYGKSLCYQYPSVYTGRTTVVVSPLISLMEDQVLALSAVKIPACFLGSAQEKMAEVRREMLQGKYRVVYLTPEFCEVARDVLRELHSNVGVDLVAIDEAHCVCQWGHDFRKAYRCLGTIRQLLPQVPLMALTATATPAVTKDICKSLGLRNPLLTSTGFDRVNLFLSASQKSGDMLRDLKSRMVRQGAKYVFEGSVIVYCPTKKATEDIQRAMTTLGVKSGIYHAGLSKSTRRKTHQQFVNDQIQVVVATVAFGMGIDKPDVRQVIHYGAPKDIESYYQEMGRAGRDGDMAKCHVFYTSGDFNTNMFLLKDIDNKVHYEHRLKMLRKMMDYLPSKQCRRKLILVHFEDKCSVRMRSSCCDNCQEALLAQARGHELPDHSKPSNFGPYALDLFKVIELMHHPRGLGTYCLFLLGSASEKLQRYSNDPLFGKYKGNRTVSKKFLQALGRQLVAEGYLSEEKCVGFFGTVVSLQSKGGQFLERNRGQGEPQLLLVPNAELVQLTTKEVKAKPVIVGSAGEYNKVILPTVPAGEWLSTSELQAKSTRVADTPVLNDTDKRLLRQLLAKLMSLRNEIASENGLNSFNVFTNRTLSDMAMYRPTNQENLSQIDGVALQRVNLYGESFMNTIREFCAEHDWPCDIMPQEQKVTIELSGAMEQAFIGLSDTCQTSYSMFEREARTLEDTAMTRGIKTSTVCSHMASCIEAGLPVNIERLGVTTKIQELIVRTVRAPPINSDISRMTPIKEQLPDYVTFDQIRVVVAIMKRRYGLTNCDYVAEETGSAATQSAAAKQSSLLQFVRDTDSTPKLNRQSASFTQYDRCRDYQETQDQQPLHTQHSSSSQGSSSSNKKRALPQSLLRASSLSKKQKTDKMRKNSLFTR